MVYNRESVWLHLYTAYERMIRDAAFPGLDIEEAFARNTDGAECPISRCYPAGEFAGMCCGGRLRGRFAGRLPLPQELRSLSRAGPRPSPMGGWPASTETSCAR